jgi:HD-GYP domain-containing protein (c-di-GMP phosphodiesterase class II)
VDSDAEKIGELERHIDTLEQINEGLRQSFEELSQLYRLSETIASALTFSRVLTLLLDVMREVVEYDAGMLFLYDERGAQLRPNLEKNVTPELKLRFDAQIRDGTLVWALKQGRILVLADSGQGTWTQGIPEQETGRSFLLVPILARGKPVGLLDLAVSAGAGSFSQRDLSLLGILANQTGISLENARLYEAVRQDYVDLIQALAGAVDARDHYTREHSNRVSLYGVAIARQLKLDESFIETVQFGGLLHDIGKIGIPDLILNKPGRLTEDEFQVMKGHCSLGAGLLRRVESLSHLVPLVLYHHERFDGRGYPEGLAGKKIPLGARILNVADSFETITSDRVYHKARSPQEGLEEIRRCSGGQFDPEIVAAFEAVYGTIVSWREKLGDTQ